MISKDVRFEGFSAEDWTRLLDLFRMPRRTERRGGVIAVVTGSRLRKLVSTRSGRLDPAAQEWPTPLEALAARHDVRWAIQLHTGALEDAMDRLADRIRPDQDLLAQAMDL